MRSLTLLVIAACGSGSSNQPDASQHGDASSGDTQGMPRGLHASGNQIVDGSGQPVRLLGVNRSGTEYACIQGFGIFDGPDDDASVAAIAAWHANAVRVPLNEDCWLAINGAPAAYSGASYQQAIHDYVQLLEAHGMAAVLELHWNAPGGQQATGQQEMPDQDHAPAFWSSVAAAYGSDGSVVLDLYNEPHDVDWTCWRAGGTCAGVGYQVAGMQELVDTVRGAGATNLILLGGLGYSNDLSQWLAHMPNDPQHDLAAAIHVYGGNACDTRACLDGAAAAVAAQVPLVAGEIGESYDDSICGTANLSAFTDWFDQHGASYLAWTWDTWGTSCADLSLITDYSGTPKTPNGTYYKDHLIAVHP